MHEALFAFNDLIMVRDHSDAQLSHALLWRLSCRSMSQPVEGWDIAEEVMRCMGA